MRINAKGQVTIPIHLREQAGLLPNTEVGFEFDGSSVRLFPCPSPADGRRDRLLRCLQGRATLRLTTDQIMAMTRRS
jgi:bifunctional DNA-binding transcriptional regulator/antitoxin component of YhaV-PrlF toxin-antitoxin module